METKKYINELYFNSYIAIKDYFLKFNFKNKLLSLIKYLFEIWFTGFVVLYSIDHRNAISVGLLFAWITYYIEWFVKLCKKKENINDGITSN